ncbi:hypothetical protein HDU67_005521 [Dinochytrium kinnereticum]|nr:hypothetical protein HDU67_005521 [Dinochytrium kinnereticum]
MGNLRTPAETNSGSLPTPPLSPSNAERVNPINSTRKPVVKVREMPPTKSSLSSKPARITVKRSTLTPEKSGTSLPVPTGAAKTKIMTKLPRKALTTPSIPLNNEPLRKVLRGGDVALLDGVLQAVMASAAEPLVEENDADDEGANEKQFAVDKQIAGDHSLLNPMENVKEDKASSEEPLLRKALSDVEKVFPVEAIDAVTVFSKVEVESVNEEIIDGAAKEDVTEDQLPNLDLRAEQNGAPFVEADAKQPEAPAEKVVEEAATDVAEQVEHAAAQVAEDVKSTSPGEADYHLEAIPEDKPILATEEPQAQAPYAITQPAFTGGAHIVTGKTFTILDESGNPVPITIPAVVQLDVGAFSDTTSIVSHEYDSDAASHRNSMTSSRIPPKMSRIGSNDSTPSSLTPVPIRRIKRRQIDMSDLTGLVTLATSRLNDLRAIHPALRSSTTTSPHHSLKKSYLSAAKEISLLGKGISTAWLPVARACTDRRLRERLLASLTACETSAGRMKVLIKLKSGEDRVDSEGVLLSCAAEVVRSAQDAVKDLEAARILLEANAAVAGKEIVGVAQEEKKVIIDVSDDEDKVMIDREPGVGGMEAAVKAAILAGGNVANTFS